MKRFILVPLLIIVTAGVIFAQETLNNKWDAMLEKGETYQNYKVIKRTDLNEIWKSVQDSLSRYKTELNNERKNVKEQGSQIISLQKQLEEVKGKLESVTMEKDSMNLLGIQIDKYTYAMILWAIIVVVLAACGILLFLFKNSNHLTVQKTRENKQLSDSFEEYKQSKIEVERKLRRELQTQINMIEELKKK